MEAVFLSSQVVDEVQSYFAALMLCIATFYFNLLAIVIMTDIEYLLVHVFSIAYNYFEYLNYAICKISHLECSCFFTTFKSLQYNVYHVMIFLLCNDD